MRPSLPASAALAVACLASSSSAAIQATFDIGSGSSTSSVQVDFANGNGYLFNVSWNQPMTGYQLLQTIDAGLDTVSHSAQTYSFGVFVTGIGVGADNDFGTGDLWPIENYWHYWTQDSGSWQLASVGASSRTIFDGSFDAWVFGSPAVPQAVPAPGALALFALGLRSRRR
ncbi:MAG: hypothetical protein FJ270_09465 [Planctomycetes bacterium]|nr:hypothetical protein [Planctomycetota bacterium]